MPKKFVLIDAYSIIFRSYFAFIKNPLKNSKGENTSGIFGFLSTLEKIKKLREIDKVIPIEVDGCMNPENARLAKGSGANIFASGSYIFKSDNTDEAINELQNAIA